jgi:threonylcarbamoyladenosine tRNA methylthiotransferase MtaB
VRSHREILESIPGVVLLAPNEAKPKLGEALSRMQSGMRSGAPGSEDPWPQPPRWLDGDATDTFRPGISRFVGRTRAFVKVQDGCSLACAYCIVPKVRGRSRSRRIQDAVDEARRLVEAGYPELVLTGVHLGLYGQDLPDRPRLFDLVALLLEIPGRWRLRLSSIEANELRDGELLAFADGCDRGADGRRPRLCPHLHLPLQSGSADVLRRMRRMSTPESLAHAAGILRGRMADVALSTDLLVGFPGESDRDFEATLEAVRRLAFSRIHAFPFSARPGTEAAGWPGVVSPAAVRERMRALDRLARESAAAFHRRFIGRSVDVLVEARPDRRTGRPCGYSEHYVRVALAAGAPRGVLVRARVTDADETGAVAVPVHHVPRPEPMPV